MKIGKFSPTIHNTNPVETEITVTSGAPLDLSSVGDTVVYRLRASGAAYIDTINPVDDGRIIILLGPNQGGESVEITNTGNIKIIESFILDEYDTQLTLIGVDSNWRAIASQGAKGPEGDQGVTEDGDQGDPGPPGPTGTPGEVGEVGADGLEPGPDGPTGEQGPEGEQGDEGAEGPEGITGPMGPTGPQGITGADGDPGIEGPTGQPGEPCVP